MNEQLLQELKGLNEALVDMQHDCDTVAQLATISRAQVHLRTIITLL